jgi:hypothetical protein
MRISRAVRASCGVLLATVLMRTVDAGRDELANVRAADGTDDASVSAAEGAEDTSVSGELAEIASVEEAAASEELIVIEDAIVREEALLRAWARRTRRTYG